LAHLASGKEQWWTVVGIVINTIKLW